jgi:CMP-N-acetylneuraminic acid synthetase
MKVYALVTARAGSKGVPGKNTRHLGGKPLLVWTIESARRSTNVHRVLLSTENHEIAQIGRSAGAEVPFERPFELASDAASHIDVVLHSLSWLKQNDGALPDYLLLLQPTSPFRTSQDIEAAISLAKEPSHPPAVVSVCECVHHPCCAQRILPDGTLENFVRHDLPDERRQALPKLYVPNGAIYLNLVQSLINTRSFQPPGTRAYVMPPERSLDIDTPWNFHIAELLVRTPYGSIPD